MALFSSTISHCALGLCGVLFLAASPFGAVLPQGPISTSAFAQADQSRQFSRKAGRLAMKALDAFNANDYGAALKHIDKALKIKTLNAYEAGALYQMQGQAYYELEKTDAAISAFEQAIATTGLTEREASSLRKNIGKLNIVQGRYALGAAQLEPKPEDSDDMDMRRLEVLLNAWLMAEDYERALPWAELWLERSSAHDRQPYDLLIFIYTALGDAEKQATLMERMIVQFPKDERLPKTLNALRKYGVLPAAQKPHSTQGMIPSFKIDPE